MNSRGEDFSKHLCHEMAMRSILLRRGLLDFRNILRARYGGQCMVTGCKVADLIEAAHVAPESCIEDIISCPEENGVTLRSDIHTLFDLDLIGIHPLSLRVHFHPSLLYSYRSSISSSLISSGYNQFEGQPLLCSDIIPNRIFLTERWARFLQRYPMNLINLLERTENYLFDI